MIGNCWTFAYLRRWRKGGGTYTVKSKYGWWRHAYYVSRAGYIWEFVPVKPHKEVLKDWFGILPVLFHGRPRLSKKRLTRG